MESYEHVVKVWMESKGYAVSSGVKFMLKLPTQKKVWKEEQEHGYEVDLIAARRDKLVLVNVKSYFGSKGLSLVGLQREKMFSRDEVWKGIFKGACERYGYSRDQVELWVVAGRVRRIEQTRVRDFLKEFSKRWDLQTAFFTAVEVANGLMAATDSKTYMNDPVIATVRTFRETGHLGGL
jgi:hypothetical protein